MQILQNAEIHNQIDSRFTCFQNFVTPFVLISRLFSLIKFYEFLYIFVPEMIVQCQPKKQKKIAKSRVPLAISDRWMDRKTNQQTNQSTKPLLELSAQG